MHVITGGAYNGKWHFVKEFYHLTDEADFIKYSGYNNDKLPVDLLQIQTKYLIIQHLEMYVKKFFENDASVHSQTEAFVINCLNWLERNLDCKLILIDDDILIGVLLMNRSERKMSSCKLFLYIRLI